MDEYLNTDALGKQFGEVGCYYNARINFPNSGKGLPGSRGKDNARIASVQNWSMFAQQERGERRKGNIRNANVTNGEEPARENEEGIEKEEYCEYQEDWEEPRDVYCAGNEDEPSSELDWEEVGNYGPDSEVEQFLQNNEETQGYEGLRSQADMGVYKISAEEQISRDRKGKNPRNFKQFRKKLTWAYKGRDGFRTNESGCWEVRGKESFPPKKRKRA